MELVVEYLVIIEKKANEALYNLCDTVKDFHKLLSGDPNVEISGKQIRFQNSLKCTFDVSTGQVTGKTQRFFHLKVAFSGDEAQINDFLQLLKSIKGSLYRAGSPPESLWDDISLFYSQKAYPLVHKAENLMRKLITYFMLTTIGKQWSIENLPKSVEDAIERSKRKQYLDILHQLDFSHLGDFLFKEYPTKKLVNELFEQLDEVQTVDELDLQELRDFIPRSNWERYFSDVVEYSSGQSLKKKWDQLYELRCKVAHNAIVTRGDFERIEELVAEVNSKLQDALDNLDKVHVSEEDREEIAENVVSNINALYGEFIQEWKRFEATLQQINDYFSDNDGEPRFMMPRQIVRRLQQKELVSEELIRETEELSLFRNSLVHNSNLDVSEQNIRLFVSRLQKATRAFQELSTVKSSWRDEIIVALRVLGGKANLADLYNYIEANTSRKLADTWRATVRYTLQTNSSSSKSFSTGKDVFVRLDRGLWGIRNNDIEELSA